MSKFVYTNIAGEKCLCSCIQYEECNIECSMYRRFTGKQTNYDRIISKTPEEMAELIGDNIDCNICKEKYSADECPRTVEKNCYGVWLDWLKSPVEVDDGT